MLRSLLCYDTDSAEEDIGEPGDSRHDPVNETKNSHATIEEAARSLMKVGPTPRLAFDSADNTSTELLLSQHENIDAKRYDAEDKNNEKYRDGIPKRKDPDARSAFLNDAHERFLGLQMKRKECERRKGKFSYHGHRNQQDRPDGPRKRKIVIDMSVSQTKRCCNEGTKSDVCNCKSQTESMRKQNNLKETLDVVVKCIPTKFNKQKTVNEKDLKTSDQLPNLDVKICEEYDPHGRKKTRIERDLEEAIKMKDFELAEEINDEISERDIAQSLTDAFKAKDYLEKQRSEKAKQAKKKKKLNWMFDQKEKWEVKGNM